MPTECTASTLYLVGTPIGNLEDITFRAIRTLKSVDLIAAEDTRHTGKLLHHFDIKTPQVSYYEHNQQQRIPELLNKLEQGRSIALVTDAGMPGISDPGYELVKACIDRGFDVVPIPGVSACVTAVSASGLPSDRFVFEGFLPAKGQDRQNRLEALVVETRAIVLYESPHRLRETLQDLAKILGGDRAAVLGRELTKLHEQFWRGTLNEAIAYYESEVQPQGEFTLVIAPGDREEPILSPEAIKAELQALLHQGISRSQASRQLAKNTALSRRDIYQIALSLEID